MDQPLNSERGINAGKFAEWRNAQEDIQTTHHVSATGKRLTGANARRRRQAARRIELWRAITGPATYEHWQRQPAGSYNPSFEALRAVMRQCCRQT